MVFHFGIFHLEAHRYLLVGHRLTMHLDHDRYGFVLVMSCVILSYISEVAAEA